MSIAALIRAMSNAGAPPEAIAIAVEAIEEAQSAVEAKRAVERDRKRRQRGRDKDGTVTGQSRDSHGHVPPAAPTPAPSFPPDPPTNPTPAPGYESTRAMPKFAPPEGVTAEQFKAFRQQRKKPLNERSYTLLCSKLQTLAEAGWPPGEMIDLAIERGWETVFEPKDQANGRGDNRRGDQRLGRHQPVDGLSATTRAALAVFGPDPCDAH